MKYLPALKKPEASLAGRVWIAIVGSMARMGHHPAWIPSKSNARETQVSDLPGLEPGLADSRMGTVAEFGLVTPARAKVYTSW